MHWIIFLIVLAALLLVSSGIFKKDEDEDKLK